MMRCAKCGEDAPYLPDGTRCAWCLERTCPGCGCPESVCGCDDMDDDGPGATECKCCGEPLTGGELAGGLCLVCDSGDCPDCN